MRLPGLMFVMALAPAVPTAAQPAERRPAPVFRDYLERMAYDADRALRDVERTLRRNGAGIGLARVVAAQARLDTEAALSALSLDLYRAGRVTAPEPWQAQDPADSLYRSARTALNRGDYWRAAEQFQRIRERYPRSAYAGDAHYYEAYSRYRRGGSEGLHVAAELLQVQEEKYPSAATRNDARELLTRIQGALARQGDEAATRALVEAAAAAAVPPVPPVARVAPVPPVAATPPVPSRRGAAQSRACRDEDDIQTAAINGLLQMSSERALPIVRKVLERRDPGSECLRRKAVFIASQVGGSEVESILLGAARNDPDAEVRSQAVFWLSQVPTPRAAAALDSILFNSKDPVVQDKAIFALSQHESAAARQALRRYAERGDITADLREKAVFWIGQGEDPENAAFLRGLFTRVREQGLKDKILFSISQRDDAESGRWLGEVARNQNESTEIRKKALFWLGQRDGTSSADIASLYGTFSEREIKEQLIFVLSQKGDRAAVDKLVDIARREPDKELQKKAIFWLTQVDDPRVADILAEILTRP